MKVLVGAFNQEKALLGAFSVIGKTDCETDGSFYSTTILCAPRLATRHPASTAAAIPHTHGRESSCSYIHRDWRLYGMGKLEVGFQFKIINVKKTLSNITEMPIHEPACISTHL